MSKILLAFKQVLKPSYTVLHTPTKVNPNNNSFTQKQLKKIKFCKNFICKMIEYF